MNIFEKIKKKWQFRKFVIGYSKGYEQGALKCKLSNGRFLRLSRTDITVRSGFVKKPKFKFLLAPFMSGFELGYTEAIGDYNGGDTPVKVLPYDDILEMLKTEFDKDYSQK